MKNFRRRTLVVLGLAAGLIASAFNRPAQAQPPGPARIRVYNGLRGVDDKGRFLRIGTFVSLFKAGVMVRSADLYNSPNNASGSLDWTGLDVGTYEVHFQTKGYGTVIKKIALSSEMMPQVNLDSVSKNDEVWDGGPTVYEMEAQIQALHRSQLELISLLGEAKQKNTDLEARLAALEKASKK